MIPLTDTTGKIRPEVGGAGAMTERFNVSALKAEMVKAIMGSNPVRT